MIKRHLPILNSPTIRYFFPFRFLGVCYCYCYCYCMAARPSNSMLGQRDFQMLSLRNLSSGASLSSAVAVNNGRLIKFRGCGSQNHRNVLGTNGDFRIDPGGDAHKERAYALRVSDWVVKVENQQPPSVGSCVVNGSTSVAHKGNYRGVWDQPLPEKIMVAVDVDEVLGNFVSALNKFIEDHYSLKCSVSDYNVYEFFKIWNCSRAEADIRVHEFFKTTYFKKGIHPLPGAQKALQRLADIYNLSIVTSRQNVIKQHTLEWIEKHYPGLFQEIHFGNHFALDGQSRCKSDICKCLGAKVLIDDNPRYALECAEAGIKVLLFNYENSYPWSKMEREHPLITKVCNWEEVEDQLVSATVS